jgi:hypothetical protein
MTHELSIRSSDDLEAAWRFVDQGLGYGAAQTFALLVEPGGDVAPTIVQIYDDELPEHDRDHMVGNFIDALRQVGGPGWTVALMRARPGGPAMTAEDRHWCRLIHQHLRRTGLDTYPIFFASDDSLGAVPPDALIAA